MTGKLIGAEEAERIGLANARRAGRASSTRAVGAARRTSCWRARRWRSALAKRVMDASARPALSTTLELEVVAQERCAASADFAEGARAFAEKRLPEFSGS